ncbi:hypothetical protein RV14_GL002376 [Enterococcus ratti]|uniref:Uncharacterized protein n=2 Tax=Enterococcus ratti TaxID=150033 RepID=A0A1L8WLE1_9ENTE|nr:hypothetical protein RV14_GL002376 [Enterococcus ratti]
MIERVDEMKKKLQVAFYILATFIMVVNQLGITSVVTAKTIDSSDDGETVVYHDYAEYEKALNEYNKEYAQYEKDLNEYNQKKQQHDEVQEVADRIEKENAQKKRIMKQL